MSRTAAGPGMAGEAALLAHPVLAALRQGIAVFDAAARLVAATPRAVALGELDPAPGAPPATPEPGQARIRPDGTVVAVTSDPLPDGGCVVTYTDVTAQAAAEAAQRAEAGQLRATLDALRQGVAVFGPDRRLVVMNRLARRLSGTPEGFPLPGARFDEVVDAQAASGLFGEGAAGLAEAARIKRLDRRQPIRYQRATPGGEVIEVTSDPTPDGGFVLNFMDITARAQAEAAARERAGTLAAALDAMRHGCLIFDPDRRLLVANAQVAEICGLSPGDLVPGCSREAFLRLQLARGLLGEGAAGEARLREVLARDPRQPGSERRRLPNGRFVEILWAPTEAGGQVVTFADITALATAKAAARDHAALLQTMQDSMRHGIALFGPDARLLMANSQAAELAGLQPGDVVPGMAVAALNAIRLRRGVFASAAAAAAASARDRRTPHRSRRTLPDGRVVEGASDPTPDGGFVLTWTDVTALSRADAAAAQRAATQQAMIENMRTGVALFGPGRELLAANRLAEQMVGYEPGALRPGRRLDELVAAQEVGMFTGDAALDRSYRTLAVEADRSRPLRYTRPSRDGRVLEVASDPMPDGGFVVTLSDITALARAEAEAKQRAAMLQAALDTMRHGIMLFGPDRRLLASNALAREIGGLQAEELRPGILLEDQLRRQHARGMYGPGAEGDGNLARLLAADRGRPWRRTRRMPDGKVVEVYSDPTPDGGFVVSFTDVTARALAEADARQRAATLQVTLDNVRHGIAMYGPDRRLLVANRLAGPRHGLDDLHGRAGVAFDALVREQQALGLFGPEPEAARTAAELIGIDRSRPIRYRRRMPDGRVLDIGSDPTPDGGFVVTTSDVTDLEQAKAEASERAAVLQVMLDNLRHGIRYFGPDHRLIAFNNLVDALTGNAPQALRVGIGFEALLQWQAEQGIFGDAEATAAALRMGHTLNRGVPARYVRRTPQGRILEVTSSPTPDGGFVVIHADVTELLEAQGAAADRAALLQVMLDSMRHGIALFDRDCRLLTANALVAELIGIPAAALRPGRQAAELLREAVEAGMMTEAALQAVLEEALEEGPTRPSRRSRQRPDGRVIEVFCDPTPDGGFVVTYSDVTAVTLAEAAARERAGILQVMLDNIRHGICYYGADRRVIAANALAAELAGHPPGALRPGRSLDALVEEQLALQVLGGDSAAVARMAREMDRSLPARYVRPCHDGRILEVTSDPTPDGGFVVTSSDITALMDAEQAVRHRADILQAMLENSRQGIMLFDLEGRVVAANGMAAALNGLPPEALQPGRHIHAMIADQAEAGYFDAEVLGEALSLVPRDRPWPVPYTRQRTLQHGRIIEVTTDRAGEAGYIRSYRDISDEQRARAELERARDAAEAANKAKSRFLATMSHELRTPLNAVIGFSEAFMVDRDPVRGRDYVQSIHEAGRHLLSLIDDILDVTRSETTGFAVVEGRVDLGALAGGVVRVMQATAATAQVAIQAALPAILPLVRADELRLRQVLLNLVANAVKFTPAGGTVTLGAAIEPGGDLLLRVSDTGIGMAAADIPRAFEAFTQLDSSLSRRFPGSGLGLYLSRALAEAQGATLTLESAPGAGTTAVLRIPKARLLAD
ncbi:PAS-domain containing protein [Paeniroseomonas aquatica]|uniref:histidine kinase n=1 Tax=Paeniroseomonas aquatica TaxID=373043 RepID=A0ABT8A6R4_9PROT|nr:PAS domain-containing sensor histidine kinase [Paeniroseomonas aquatica]MDN3565228.1 PAS-domain containing protein [Paeniroseomonas aquatica]